jgi:predicted PurR-regulated permease PerM
VSDDGGEDRVGKDADEAAARAREAAERVATERRQAAGPRDDAALHRDDAQRAVEETRADNHDAAGHRNGAAEHPGGGAGHRDDTGAHRDDAQRAVEETRAASDEAAGHRDDAEQALLDARAESDQAAGRWRGAEQALLDARAASDQAQDAHDQAVELLEGDPVVDKDVRAEEAGVDDDNPLGRPGRPMNRLSPFRIGFAFTAGAGLAYLLYQALVSARSVLVLVLVAAFLAIGLNPTVSRLERTGLRRGGAVAIVFLGLLAFFTAFGYAVLPPVVTQVANFVEALPNYVRELQDNPTVNDLDERFGLVDRLNDYVTGDLGGQVAGNIVDLGQQVAGLVFKGLTILILTLYFLSSFNTIKETAYRLVPRSRRARVTLIGDEILGRVGGYVAGAVVVGLIAGTSTLVWVSAMGVPYPLALALIVAITDVIPLIGATIGAVLVTAVAFFVSLPVGIATGVFFLIYQQVENYFIYPRVMSRSVDVNPAAAIVGALVGGTLLGFVGALLAVPATAAIQLILREVLVPRQDAQ